MPKEYSHLLLAEKFIDDNSILGKLFSVNHEHVIRPAFFLGSIIPDVFFYDFPFFRIRSISSYLHEARGENLFKIVISLIHGTMRSETETAVRLSFSLGILLHLATDMVWHPVIIHACKACNKNPKAPNCKRSMACHFRTESVLDIEVIKYLGEYSIFPHITNWLRPFSKHTEAVLSIFVSEVNKLSGSKQLCNLSSTRRCFITQAVCLPLFQKKVLYWISYTLNILTFRQFDIFQAVFYPPQNFMQTNMFSKLLPFYKDMFQNSNNNFIERGIRETFYLANIFLEIAVDLWKGEISSEEALGRFLNNSIESGVNGNIT